MSIQIQTVTSGSCSMDYFHFGNGPKTLVILPGLSVQSVMKSAAAVAHAYQMFTEDFTVQLYRLFLLILYQLNDIDFFELDFPNHYKHLHFLTKIHPSFSSLFSETAMTVS